MYHMEFIIVLNNERNGGDLEIYNDNGNNVLSFLGHSRIEDEFSSLEEIICFYDDMPYCLIELNDEVLTEDEIDELRDLCK